MSGFKISTNNGTIDLNDVMSVSSSTSNTTPLTIPGYNNISFRQVSSTRGHLIDCCSTNNKYNFLDNGVKKDIFNAYNIASKTLFHNNYLVAGVNSYGPYFKYDTTTIDFTTSQYENYTHFRVALWGGGAVGKFGSSFGNYVFKGGGGGGGAFILTEKLETSNVVKIQINPAYPQRNTGGISSILVIYYDNATSATLICQGGSIGTSTIGGAGGTYDSNADNSDNILLTETQNGNTGSDRDQGSMGGDNGYSNSSYQDLVGIGTYRGDGLRGIDRNVITVRSTPGAIQVWFYVE